jgi:hypothetical protein
MRRSILIAVLTAGFLALAAGSASACLNDRETAVFEKQFKSDYLQKPTDSAPSESRPPRIAGRLGIVGFGLLLGGICVGFGRGIASLSRRSTKNAEASK